MEELKILYKELQERQKHLESRKKTKITEGRIAENLLTILRVQQLLIPLVVQRSKQLPNECQENWESSSYCSLSDKCEKCKDVR